LSVSAKAPHIALGAQRLVEGEELQGARDCVTDPSRGRASPAPANLSVGGELEQRGMPFMEVQLMSNGQMTGKPLIESDRVEGTSVYDPQGKSIGSIKRLMIEKLSGKVTYAEATFGGFMGLGGQSYHIPWSKLTYEPRLGGYRTDITESQLRGSPSFTRDASWDWTDRNRERELHDHYREPYYWGV
jgi:hypothetical protein